MGFGTIESVSISRQRNCDFRGIGRANHVTRRCAAFSAVGRDRQDLATGHRDFRDADAPYNFTFQASWVGLPQTARIAVYAWSHLAKTRLGFLTGQFKAQIVIRRHE
jgi:hypothetical protein